jgi:ParB family chromosome partitioning protein
MDGRLTAGHARALLGLPSRQEQDQLANRIIEENLTVREIEKIVRDGTFATKGTKSRPVNKSVAELEVERILSELLSTRVGVKIGSRRGKITIDFANSDDLSRILEIIEGSKSQ